MIKENEISHLFTPFENVLLKCVWLFKVLSSEMSSDSCPMIDFINLWIEKFPEDKSDVIDVFLTTRAGRTVDNELVSLFEKVSYYGLIGNANKIVPYGKEYRDLYASIKKKLLNGEVSINENLGNEIWAEVESVLVPSYLWIDDVYNKLNININTGAYYELYALLGYDDKIIRNLITLRDDKKLFENYDEVKLIK